MIHCTAKREAATEGTEDTEDPARPMAVNQNGITADNADRRG